MMMNNRSITKPTLTFGNENWVDSDNLMHVLELADISSGIVE